MNNQYYNPGAVRPVTQKNSFSVMSMISIVGAILFSIATFCMSFVPFYADSNTNLLKMWTFENSNSEILKNWDKFYNLYDMDSYKSLAVSTLIQIIGSTVVFFGLILVVLVVVCGKCLQFKRTGRSIALTGAVIGLILSVFMLGSTIFFIISMNNFMNDMASKYSYYSSNNMHIGIGPILMTIFSVLTLVFCCLGLSDSAAFAPDTKAPHFGFGGPAVPPSNQYVNNNTMGYSSGAVQNQPKGFQNVQGTPLPPSDQLFVPAANPAPNAPPVPSIPPVPVSPIQSDHVIANDDDSPTEPQKGAIEGIKGEYKTAVIDLKPGIKLILGRDPSVSNIVFSSDSKDISRSHCSVKYDPYTNCYKVIDTSSNGTYANDKQLPNNQETQLPRGTVISLGKGENQFRLL